MVGIGKIMKEMEIKSAHSGTRLRFSDIQGDYFYATLTSPEYSGTVRIWAYTASYGLAELFEAMAKQWRGWTGEMNWSSIEGEFAITCTRDKLGHITLNIEMRQDFGDLEPWRLRAGLVVDAGQLDRIAKDARKFFTT
jgi:hypothetical protein